MLKYVLESCIYLFLDCFFWCSAIVLLEDSDYMRDQVILSQSHNIGWFRKPGPYTRFEFTLLDRRNWLLIQWHEHELILILFDEILHIRKVRLEST